jgi:RNA polymerase-binding transcription factor DksA
VGTFKGTLSARQARAEMAEFYSRRRQVTEERLRALLREGMDTSPAKAYVLTSELEECRRAEHWFRSSEDSAVCRQCGRPVAAERLKEHPYTSLCAYCAQDACSREKCHDCGCDIEPERQAILPDTRLCSDCAAGRSQSCRGHASADMLAARGISPRKGSRNDPARSGR